MSVKAQTEKNFRRPKGKPTKRKGRTPSRFSWRAARVLVSAVLVVYAGYRAVELVVSASTLQVRKIAVRGNVRLSSGEVHALVDGLRGTNILTADLEGYRVRLLDSPWVAEVALRRVLPSTIEVFVRERLPVGLCRLRGELYLVDRQGTLIDQFGPQYAEFDLPIIDGLVRVPGSGEPTIDEERAELAARVIEALAARESLARRVSEIDVSDPHNAIVLLEDDPALLYLGDERFLERLQSYVDLSPALRQRVPDMDYVDLRFEDRMYVRPGGKSRPPAAVKDRPSPAAKKF